MTNEEIHREVRKGVARLLSMGQIDVVMDACTCEDDDGRDEAFRYAEQLMGAIRAILS